MKMSSKIELLKKINVSTLHGENLTIRVEKYEDEQNGLAYDINLHNKSFDVDITLDSFEGEQNEEKLLLLAQRYAEKIKELIEDKTHEEIDITVEPNIVDLPY